MSTGEDLDRITRLVARTVQDRLGSADAGLLEVVVREVVEAMSGSSQVPPRSTPLPSGEVGQARDNGDGTMTTPRGTVLPLHAGSGSLELCARCLELSRSDGEHRAVVTTTGRNRAGLLAAIATEIARSGGDIQDVSQTIVVGFFTMIMVVDVGSLSVPFAEFKDRVVTCAQGLGIHAVVMHESVLTALQRV